MCLDMATPVCMREKGEFLLISVNLKSYHFRLSTDLLGCVAYVNVGASRHDTGPNIHAIEMASLKDSRFVMLSVGPADDPTREDHSVFLDLNGKALADQAPEETKYAAYERGPAMAPGSFSVYARLREDGQSVIIPRHSAGSTDLEKHAQPGRSLKMYVPSSDQAMDNHLMSMYDTRDDIVLVFRDGITHLFGPDEQVVNMTLSFGNHDLPKRKNTIDEVLGAYTGPSAANGYPDMPRMYLDHMEGLRPLTTPELCYPKGM